jgi:hypothetical protein
MATKNLTLERFAGISNRLPPERINSYPGRDNADIDLVGARNVDIDNARRLSRRTGQTMKVAGTGIHSLWSNGALCLYVKDGIMYRLNSDFSSDALAAGVAAAPMCYVELNGRVYHSNGDTSAVYDDGRVRSWGIGIGQISVAAAATGGSMPAGVYQFAMTLLREDGQESGTGLASQIDLGDAGGLAFSWEVPPDPGITHAALYLTQPDGETLLQAAVVDVELGHYVYTGGARALPLATQWLDAPPVGQALAFHRGRLYIAAGDVLYATAALAYEHCDLRDYCAFDGTPIQLLAPVTGGLFVGTSAAVYFLGGDTLAARSVVRKLDTGTVRGSVAYGDGEAVTGRRELSGQEVALFTTADGVVMGLPDGSLVQLTRERYNMRQTGVGAALFEAGPYSRYLLSMQV